MNQSKYNCFTAVVACCFLIVLQVCKQNNSSKIESAIKDTVTTTVAVTNNPYKLVDQSPLDIIYCPDEFPQKKMKGELVGDPIARIIYSRPHKKGRTIFSNDSLSLCPYGKPWRLGANEATEVELFRPVLVNGKNVPAGRYVLYCIPYVDRWDIVFNSNLHSWGLDINKAKDVLKIEVPVLLSEPSVEDFTMMFLETAVGADLMMTWDNVKVLLSFTFSK